MTSQLQLFDSHMHIIDARFPLIENQGFLPESFTVPCYQKRLANFALGGGAVVSGSFQGFDQNYLIAALGELGPDYVGVTQLPASVEDSEILSLHRQGVRALRFNFKRGGQQELKTLVHMAQRVHELADWHSELYIDARQLAPMIPYLKQLPLLSIDHLGLHSEGLSELLQLVELGARVKATGFGRLDFSPLDVMQQIYAINPEALMFGSDLPSTRARRPFEFSDIDLITEHFDRSAAHNILYKNAHAFYLRRRSYCC